MPQDEPVEFPDVELLHEAPAVLRFRINGADVMVPRGPGLLSAHGMVKPGDKGTLRLTRWMAEHLKLVP